MNSDYLKIKDLLKKNKLKEALYSINNILNHEENYELVGLKASIYLKLGEYQDSYDSYTKAIDLDKNSFNFFVSRAIASFELGEFKRSIVDFKEGLKINNNSPAVFENIGKCYSNLGENDKAIEYYQKALELSPNNHRIIEMIAEKLSETNFKIKKKNLIIDTDYLIRKIKYKYSSESIIKDLVIKELIHEAENHINNNFKNLIFNQTQIFRKNNFNLNCDRHFLVFRNFKIIPKFCFSCIKVTINVDNVVDLIKLFLVFNNVSLEKNNLRKCMIDLRANAKNNYKGFIYCRSIQEAQSIKKNLDAIVKNTIASNISSNIKRGCSEFNNHYNGYEDVSRELVSYNSEWKKYEDTIDKKYQKFNYMKKNQETLKGISLYDVMIIRNWLIFARMIKDETYKKITEKILINPHLEKLINQNKINNLKI